MSCYIVLEGGDGCGKSTQAELLVRALRDSGHAVEHVREPGSTPLAEALRALLLHGREIAPLTEALLFCAARRELLQTVIAPALRRGTIVVAERSFVSTMVYQCLAPIDPAQRVSLGMVADVTIELHADLDCWPECILVLDVPTAVGRERLGPRVGLDRIESRGAEYAERVRDGFRSLAEVPEFRRLPLPACTLRRIDADRTTEQVAEAIWREVVRLPGFPRDGANA